MHVSTEHCSRGQVRDSTRKQPLDDEAHFLAGVFAMCCFFNQKTSHVIESLGSIYLWTFLAAVSL
jgi:hypothetical protein